PLHLTMDRQKAPWNANLVALFIQQGADLDGLNGPNNTPLALLASFPLEDQAALFSLLKHVNSQQDMQELFLQKYREYLLGHLENSTILSHYYHLTSLHKLETYLKAKFEFDNAMPIGDLPSNILKDMPLYQAKVYKAIQEEWPEEQWPKE